jgi:signal recognition particle subunit SRP54
VLSKLDGDARGGAALSVAKVTGRPVMFASNGEKVGDFDIFHPDRMASRILGMGDMLTLIEQAEKTFDADQAADAAAKLTTGKGAGFTLDDFLQQMQAVRKMGSLSKIFGMLPGMGDMKQQIADIDEKEIDRIEAIIHSMTPAERADPKIIDGSRRQRISRGSGTTVAQVNGLVDRFFQARTMMNQMVSGGGMPGLPGMGGMPGMPGGGKRAKARQQAKKGRTKRGSGNPAKRAQAQQGGSARPAPAVSPFGNPAAAPTGPSAPAADDFELPKELRDLL